MSDVTVPQASERLRWRKEQIQGACRALGIKLTRIGPGQADVMSGADFERLKKAMGIGTLKPRRPLASATT